MEKDRIINIILSLMFVYFISCDHQKNDKGETIKSFVKDTLHKNFIDSIPKNTIPFLNEFDNKSDSSKVIKEKTNHSDSIAQQVKHKDIDIRQYKDSLINGVNLFELSPYMIENKKVMPLFNITTKVDKMWNFMLNESIFVLNKEHTQYLMLDPISTNVMIGYIYRDINKYVPTNIEQVYSIENPGVYIQDKTKKKQYLYSQISNFFTGKGIKLGMQENTFLRIYKNCDFMKIKLPNNVNLYVMDFFDDEYLKFLKTNWDNLRFTNYDNQLYFARYAFKKHRLIEFAFGYHYP